MIGYVIESCSTLRFPLDTPPLAFQALEYTAGGGPAEGNEPYMLWSDSEFASDGREIHTAALTVPHCQLCWAKIVKAQFVAPGEREQYRRSDIDVKRKIAAAMEIRDLPIRIRALRKALSLNQKDFGAECGVGQVAVSQWENEQNPRVPTSKALFRMSELAPFAERGWWRDRAAEQAGVDAALTNTSGELVIPELSYKVPLVINPQKIGKAGSVATADIERLLSFSPDFFPEGGRNEAVRIEGQAPNMIAVVDVARQDAERLVGKMVAVRTASGIEVRWLGEEEGSYLLFPFQPGQRVKPMRYKGEWSIVGAVRWVGESPWRPIEPPRPRRSH